MVTKHQTELQEAIDKALESASQNQLAKQMSVSPATIINIKRGEWVNVSAAMVSKLRSYFRLDSWGVRSTYNFEKIVKLCEDARENKKFMALAGYTGAGKTTALRWFKSNLSEVYYVHCNVLQTKRSFIQAIQRSMGLDEGGSINHQVESIVNKMNSGINSLLIIDDAGKLSQTCMRLLQVIYDSTEFNAGMVLSGTEYLKKFIDKNASKDVMGFRELKRRIAYWQPLQRPAISIVRKICVDYGIESKEAIQYIASKAVDYGTLRNLVMIAVKVANDTGEKVSREILADLHVGDYSYETAIQ